LDDNIAMNRLRKLGLALFLMGLAIEAGSRLWDSTRQWVSVDMPITLSPGRVATREFRVNVDALYDIEIEVQKKIPFDTLNCLLGISINAGSKCQDTPSVVEATWTLFSGDQITARGTSSGSDGAVRGGLSISRGLGDFHGDNGRRYILELKFLKDGSRLAVCDPHLKVFVTREQAQGIQIMRAFVLFAAIALCSSGIAVFFYSILYKRQQKAMANERPIPS
jgi:hypothetical protein